RKRDLGWLWFYSSRYIFSDEFFQTHLKNTRTDVDWKSLTSLKSTFVLFIQFIHLFSYIFTYRLWFQHFTNSSMTHIFHHKIVGWVYKKFNSKSIFGFIYNFLRCVKG